jgi:type I restriction enzyme M protein
MIAARNQGFLLDISDIQRDILIPRYYDPRLKSSLEALADACDFVTLDDLTKAGELSHDHGSYVPKIYYGTGPYPYIRTSDLANWEIKASPKHGVPESVYQEYVEKQGVQPGDIFFVHEGTYLIGTTAMVTPYDGPLLYQHHLAKFV